MDNHNYVYKLKSTDEGWIGNLYRYNIKDINEWKLLGKTYGIDSKIFFRYKYLDAARYWNYNEVNIQVTSRFVNRV